MQLITEAIVVGIATVVVGSLVGFILGKYFSTDLPAEPLMILMMGIYFIFLLTNKDYIPYKFLKAPIIQALIIHLLWILISALFAEKKLIAVKFFLAKIWYVSVFVFLTGMIIKTYKDFKDALWFVTIPLVFTIIIAIIKF